MNKVEVYKGFIFSEDRKSATLYLNPIEDLPTKYGSPIHIIYGSYISIKLNIEEYWKTHAQPAYTPNKQEIALKQIKKGVKNTFKSSDFNDSLWNAICKEVLNTSIKYKKEVKK